MAQWNGDGTQDPGPPPLHADPLSGLVTGGRHEQDAMRVRVVEPTLPDISAVREAMQAVLDEDSDLLLGDRLPAPGPEPAPEVAEPAQVPTPRPESKTGPPTSELPKLSGSAGNVDSGGAPGAAGREPARQRADSAKPAIPAQRTVPPPPQQRRGFSPGIAAIVLLLTVIAVLSIVAIASLIDTIASLFS